MSKFQRYFEINKVEENADGTLTVAGIASTETTDVQGEVVTSDAMKAALPEFFKYGTGNLREMHQPSAAGTVDKAHIEDGTTFIECTVVDPVAVKKVQTGVYKGFSIGGKALKKADGVISELRLSEISLVDRPANPDAVISMWKADAETAVDQLAALLNKGDITPERLMELAQGEIAKADKGEESDEDKKKEGEPEDDKKEPEEKPKDEEAEKAAGAGDVAKGWFGEEVWDAQIAIEMLSRLMGLFYNEATEDEQQPEQLVALQTAIAALKTFIVSEIQEENALKFDGAEDMAKAGKEISAKNMKKLQDLHDSLKAMGVNCGDTAKHEHGEDLAKMATLESDLKKVNDELTLAKAEIERMKNLPAPGKALLKAVAVSKSEDGGADTEAISKIAPVVDAKGEVNDAASLIKMIHAKGGAIAR